MPPRNPYDQVRVIANPQEGLRALDARGNAMQVFACNIALRAGRPPVMQLNLLAQSFNVEGVPVFMAQDPATGEPKAVRRIVYQDGSEVEFPDAPAPPIAMQPPAAAPSADPPPAPVADTGAVQNG